MDAIQEEFGVRPQEEEEEGGLEGEMVMRQGRTLPMVWSHLRGYSYDSTRSTLSLNEMETRDTSSSQPISSSSSSSSGPKRHSNRSLRCQVSMDALPLPTTPSNRSLKSYSTTSIPLSPRRDSFRRQRSSDQHDQDHPWTYYPSVPNRRQAIYQTIDDDMPHTSEEEESAITPRLIADETLRSAPGVIGLGEGWAGGPQAKSSRRWWKRKSPVTDEDDPLALWTRHVALDERKKSEGEVSGFKSVWNRSRQALGGGSMPHLPLARRTERVKGPRSTGELGTGYSAKSGSGMIRSLSNLFSRSSTTLRQSSASTPHLPSGSTLGSSAPTPQLLSGMALRSSSSVHLPRPIQSLNRFQEDNGYPEFDLAPRRPTSSGPRPPWRPNHHSSSSTHRGHFDSDSRPVSMALDGRQEVSPSRSSPKPYTAPFTLDLRRTSTFGATGVDEDQAIEDYDTARRTPTRVQHMDQGTVGLDTIAQWGQEPKAKTVQIQRSKSIFEKIKVALSPARQSRSASPATSTCNLSGVGPGSSLSRRPGSTPLPPPVEYRSLPPSRSTPALVPLKIDPSDYSSRPNSGYSLPRGRMDQRLSSGETWMKRLSMLIEGDEEDQSIRSSTPGRPETPTPDSIRPRRLSRTSSFFFRVFPTRSSSLSSDKFKKATPYVDHDMTQSNLVRYSTVDLNLVVDLPEEEGLGLDDIIVDHRRQTIIEALDLHLSFPSPPTTVPSRASSSSHSRQSADRTPPLGDPSTPTRPPRSQKRETTTHRRNFSEPVVDGLPQLEASVATSENGSSQFPETPLIPNGNLGPYTRRTPMGGSQSTKPAISLTSLTNASFYTAKEDFGNESPVREDHTPGRQSSPDSMGSDYSVVEATVEQVEGKHMRADLVQLGEVVQVNGT